MNLDLLSELCRVPGGPGREERIREVVSRELEPLVDHTKVDRLGNLIGVRSPRGRSAPKDPLRLMLAAHMDEIAMVVTAIEADGALRVTRSGGLQPYKVGEGPVEVLGSEGQVTGVLSMGSGHRADAADYCPMWKDLRIITGLSHESLAEAGVRVGSSAVPCRSVCGPVTFGDPGDPLVAAWTFDDRMGAVALIRLLEIMRERAIEPQRTTWVCFTVHEEGGCHGAKVLATRHKPEVFVAIDGCPMPSEANLSIDGRPGIWSKDKITNFDQRLVDLFCKAAERAGTELQVAVYDSAASDASKVYEVGAAARVATVGHVRENSHGYEVARLSVFDKLLDTLVSFIEIYR